MFTRSGAEHTEEESLIPTGRHWDGKCSFRLMSCTGPMIIW